MTGKNYDRKETQPWKVKISKEIQRGRQDGKNRGTKVLWWKQVQNRKGASGMKSTGIHEMQVVLQKLTRLYSVCFWKSKEKKALSHSVLRYRLFLSADTLSNKCFVPNLFPTTVRPGILPR